MFTSRETLSSRDPRWGRNLSSNALRNRCEAIALTRLLFPHAHYASLGPCVSLFFRRSCLSSLLTYISV